MSNKYYLLTYLLTYCARRQTRLYIEIVFFLHKKLDMQSETQHRQPTLHSQQRLVAPSGEY